MLDKNTDEFWADLALQEERNIQGVPRSDFLLPISGSLDDIAKSPLDYHESFTDGKQVESSDQSALVSEYSDRVLWKPPSPSTRRKKFRANPEQSKRVRWTSEEDQIILDFYQKHGANWKQLSKEFHGRAADAIKNRFYGTLRKRMNSEQKRLLSQQINTDWSLEVGLPTFYEEEENISSVSTDPILLESFSLPETDNQLNPEDKRRKVQELYNKMMALQTIISKTQQEISHLKEL